MENKPVTENLWRVWVDTRRRIVSFHEEEGSFHTQFLKAAFAVSMIKTMKRPVLFQLFLKNFCLLNGFSPPLRNALSKDSKSKPPDSWPISSHPSYSPSALRAVSVSARSCSQASGCST